jgi:hypothetical protein
MKRTVVAVNFDRDYFRYSSTSNYRMVDVASTSLRVEKQIFSLNIINFKMGLLF